MILRYGGYAFASQSCEVTYQIQTLVNERGVPYAQLGRIDVAGYQDGDDPAEISSACLAMEVALKVPFQALALYTDAGAITHVALPNAGSTTGVVVSQVSYPQGRGAELATFRRFQFFAQAEYPIGTGRGVLMAFQESVQIQGTGGERFVLKPALVGLPQKQLVQRRTAVTATQAGSAEGYLEYPTPPPPLWPQAEHADRRQFAYQGGKFRGRTWSNFRVSWSYSFESPTPLIGLPTLR